MTLPRNQPQGFPFNWYDLTHAQASDSDHKPISNCRAALAAFPRSMCGALEAVLTDARDWDLNAEMASVGTNHMAQLLAAVEMIVAEWSASEKNSEWAPQACLALP